MRDEPEAGCGIIRRMILKLNTLRVRTLQDLMTPYEKFRSLPGAASFLRPGVTREQLELQAHFNIGIECVRKLHCAEHIDGVVRPPLEGIASRNLGEDSQDTRCVFMRKFGESSSESGRRPPRRWPHRQG